MDIDLAAAFCAGVLVVAPAIKSAFPQSRGEVREILCRTGLKLVSVEDATRLARRLAQAGLEMKPEEFMGIKFVLCAAFLVACLPLLLGGMDLFWPVLFLPALWYAPQVWLNGRISDRKSRIKMALPDFSVFLSTALAAAADLPTALREAGDNTGGPLKEEVNRALRDYSTGGDLVTALTEMAERCDVTELRGLARSIAQSHRYGAPLAETIRSYAEQMQAGRRFEAMEAAGKLKVKVIFPILIFMLLPCMVVLGFPAVVSLVEAFRY